MVLHQADANSLPVNGVSSTSQRRFSAAIVAAAAQNQKRWPSSRDRVPPARRFGIGFLDCGETTTIKMCVCKSEYVYMCLS